MGVLSAESTKNRKSIASRIPAALAGAGEWTQSSEGQQKPVELAFSQLIDSFYRARVT